MRIERLGPLIIAFAVLAGCETRHPTTTLADRSASIESVDHFEFGAFTSSAWVSDSFDGKHARQFYGNTLRFEVEQFAAEGGLDVGVAPIDFQPSSTAEAKKNLYVCSSYATDLEGDGRWWAGPKISVNWQGEESAKQNGDDWYENYIVEIASTSPDALHALFTGDYFRAEELPRLELAGSSYRNYKIRFHDWWQFWSVRQDYRPSGILPVEPIIDTWIAHGLPEDRVFDGIKANIETYGPIAGTGDLSVGVARAPLETNCQGDAVYVR